MTPDDVSQIERELGVTAPSDYRALVTDYPPELFQHAADFDLMDDLARIVAMNREVRAGPFYGVTWPVHYFAIGENGCGDYHCLTFHEVRRQLFSSTTKRVRLSSERHRYRSGRRWWSESMRSHDHVV